MYVCLHVCVCVCVCVHLYEYACVHESDHKWQRITRHALLCLVCHPLPLKDVLGLVWEWNQLQCQLVSRKARASNQTVGKVTNCLKLLSTCGELVSFYQAGISCTVIDTPHLVWLQSQQVLTSEPWQHVGILLQMLVCLAVHHEDSS